MCTSNVALIILQNGLLRRNNKLRNKHSYETKKDYPQADWEKIYKML